MIEVAALIILLPLLIVLPAPVRAVKRRPLLARSRLPC
jgi:hypothetical protein